MIVYELHISKTKICRKTHQSKSQDSASALKKFFQAKPQAKHKHVWELFYTIFPYFLIIYIFIIHIFFKYITHGMHFQTAAFCFVLQLS